MTSAPIVSHFQRRRQQARIRWLPWRRRPPLHQRGRHVCPLLFPEETSQVCPIDHKQWPKGGCTTTLPTSIGARLRYQLDRDSEVYKEVYKQRTASERINSQAVELGIERPKLRNGAAIANQNSLIYVLINPSAGSGQACAPSSGCAASSALAAERPLQTPSGRNSPR